MKIHIRELMPTQNDAEALVALVTELAVVERKSLSEVKLTPEKVLAEAFGEERYFRALLAVTETGEPVGYALYFYTYAGSAGAPILYLEDLYVRSELQGKGLGTAMLGALAELAQKKKCCRLEFHVFRWNEKARLFYQSLGVELKEDLIQARLWEGECLDQLAGQAMSCLEIDLANLARRRKRCSLDELLKNVTPEKMKQLQKGIPSPDEGPSIGREI